MRPEIIRGLGDAAEILILLTGLGFVLFQILPQ